MKKIYYIIIIIIALVIFATSLTLIVFNLSPKTTNNDVSLIVQKGDTISTLSTNLKNNGLIKNSNYFKLLAKLFGKEKKLQTGHYTIPLYSTAAEILQIVTTGKQTLIKVTISEGMTLKEIAEKLDEKHIINNEKFIESVNSFDLNKYGLNIIGANGFLFPDTYFFEYELPADMVISVFTDNFFKVLKDLNVKIDESIYKKIILSSIVEKEYKIDEEAPIIASVFKNRLKINMPLQSCATVVYVITDILNKKHPERIFYSDLEIENEYNTYIHYGLPPKPICNPGKIAIKATFDDYKSDFLYFILVDPEKGKHSFSKSFSNHNKNYLNYIHNKN